MIENYTITGRKALLKDNSLFTGRSIVVGISDKDTVILNIERDLTEEEKASPEFLAAMGDRISGNKVFHGASLTPEAYYVLTSLLVSIHDRVEQIKPFDPGDYVESDETQPITEL